MRAAALLLAAACAAAPPAPDRQIETTLFLGLGKPTGGEVSQAEFDAFVAEEIAPRFPQGFTLLDAHGAWRNKDGTTAKESSRLLIIVHPVEDERAIEEIAAKYRARFAQEAVLRTDLDVRASLR
jgi:hypothetical protein